MCMTKMGKEKIQYWDNGSCDRYNLQLNKYI